MWIPATLIVEIRINYNIRNPNNSKVLETEDTALRLSRWGQEGPSNRNNKIMASDRRSPEKRKSSKDGRAHSCALLGNTQPRYRNGSGVHVGKLIHSDVFGMSRVWNTFRFCLLELLCARQCKGPSHTFEHNSGSGSKDLRQDLV